MIHMTTTSTSVAKLFTDDELDGIQPTGSPWVVNRDDPATVPVPLQTTIVDVQGPYTERDRKLWVFLLHAVFDELGDKPMHEISVKDINAIFRDLGGDHSTKWIWESKRRLARTTVEWETLGDDRMEVEEWGVSTLIFATLSAPQRRSGRLNFGFPPNLIPIIKQPRRFARLRLHFLMSLSGKYAVTLYEILEGFVNRRDRTMRVSIEELRRWLKVPDGTYQTWKNFRLRVLDPAIKQINDDPVASGFSVEYEPIRNGKSYAEIIFTMSKERSRLTSERNIRDHVAGKSRIAENKAKERPDLSERFIGEADRETRHTLDMKEMERQFWTHWESTGKPDFTHGVGRAFVGFTKGKYRQMK